MLNYWLIKMHLWLCYFIQNNWSTFRNHLYWFYSNLLMLERQQWHYTFRSSRKVWIHYNMDNFYFIIFSKVNTIFFLFELIFIIENILYKSLTDLSSDEKILIWNWNTVPCISIDSFKLNFPHSGGLQCGIDLIVMNQQKIAHITEKGGGGWLHLAYCSENTFLAVKHGDGSIIFMNIML